MILFSSSLSFSQTNRKNYEFVIDSLLTENRKMFVEPDSFIDLSSYLFIQVENLVFDSCQTQSDLNISSYSRMKQIKLILDKKKHYLVNTLENSEAKKFIKAHKKWLKQVDYEFKTIIESTKSDGSESPFKESEFYIRNYIFRIISYQIYIYELSN